MPATLTSTGQWTLLNTDLTPIKDSALSGTGATTGQGPTLYRATLASLPAIDPRDLVVGGLPSEVLAFIQLAAQGFAASFFNGAAITVGTTANLNVLATAKMLMVMLNAYLSKGLPGHDGVASRNL